MDIKVLADNNRNESWHRIKTLLPPCILRILNGEFERRCLQKAFTIFSYSACTLLLAGSRLGDLGLPIYSQTEIDLESRWRIVSKQKGFHFLCARGYWCHAAHVLHSSNKYFPKAILFDYKFLTPARTCALWGWFYQQGAHPQHKPYHFACFPCLFCHHK